MSMKTKSGRAAAGAAALAAATALVISGCASGPDRAADPPAESPSAGGVPFGASIDEYRAAFAGLEPIALTVQIDGPPGGIAGVGRAAYFEALEEWSDGRLDVEIFYATAIAGPTEVDDALADGRLDMVNILPTYQPDVLAENAAVSELGFAGPGGLTGALVWSAWMTEVVYADPAYAQEYEDLGVKMLLPNVPQWATFSQPLMCAGAPRQSLDEIAGAQVAASGAAKSAQVAGLGATPVSIPWLEQYEALERGVANCSASSISAAASGLYEVAPHMTLDTEVTFAAGGPVMAISLDTWESLPLVAQQLVFDRLDVLIHEELLAGIRNVQEVVDAAAALGGELVPYADDARAAFQATDLRLLDAFRADGVDVDAVVAAAEKWERIVGELGYGFGDDLRAVLAEAREVDSAAYIDRLFQEVLLAHRPE
ncbi:hypothetical protein [Microbacterium sp. No. 7]|uniref:hypothetical protein n=1 Tax=Microbacterium sp. No. 7 TaxID=1714373 RepID=UPI0006CF6494|nr:hypothetical protein [Microbacterium sp. No. 7]ALJ18876.1 hypothetical protein AOA12_02695 [Microbacterium sp. No. 7]